MIQTSTAAEIAAADTAATNQRQHRRYDFAVEVTATSGHQFFTGFTENISAGGLFVQTYQTMPLGSVFRLQLEVPGVDRVFELDCEVRWVREYSEALHNATPGMGVRFINLTPEEVTLLNSVLARSQTLFYDDELDF